MLHYVCGNTEKNPEAGSQLRNNTSKCTVSTKVVCLY